MTTNSVFRLIKCRIHCTIHKYWYSAIHNHIFSNNRAPASKYSHNTHTHTYIGTNANPRATLHTHNSFSLSPLSQKDARHAHDRGNDNKDTRVDFHVDYILENCKVCACWKHCQVICLSLCTVLNKEHSVYFNLVTSIYTVKTCNILF